MSMYSSVRRKIRDFTWQNWRTSNCITRIQNSWNNTYNTSLISSLSMATVMAVLSYQEFRVHFYPAVKLSFFHRGVSVAGFQLLNRLAGYEKVSWSITQLALKWWHPLFKQYVSSSCNTTFSLFQQITWHQTPQSELFLSTYFLRWERQLMIHCALMGNSGEERECTEQAKYCECQQVIRKAKPNIFWKQQLTCSCTEHTQTYSATGITNNRLHSLLVIRGQIIPQHSIQWIFGQYNRKSHTLWTL